MSKLKHKLSAVCAACALLLSGCGSSANPFRVPSINVPTINVPTFPTTPGSGTTTSPTLSESNLEATAGRSPVLSSDTVTQNAQSATRVDLSVTGGTSRPRYTLTKTGSGNNWTISDPASGNINSGSLSETGTRGGSSVSYRAYAVARNEGANRVGFAILSDRSSTSDTDYLSAGFWTEVRLSGGSIASRVDSGVFLSGSPHIGNLPASGSATYTGEAGGVYLRDSGISGAFDANASFTANFNGNATSVTGILNNFTGNDDSGTTNRLSGVQLDFARGTNSSGLYAGNVTCSSGCTGTSASGRWGGAFYGGTPNTSSGMPDLFGGTFSVSDINPSSSSTVNDVDLMGFVLTGR